MLSFADSHLTRKTPPSYADGVYMLAGQNRPSPRKLSEIFMKGSDGVGSARNRTAMLAFFGKYLFVFWSSFILKSFYIPDAFIMVPNVQALSIR